jgi:GDP-L-fucose synthase
VFVAGHAGLVGSAIERRLRRAGCFELVLRSRQELDLTRQEDVRRFFEAESIDYVYLAAAKVGGILANVSYPAEFIYENLAIQTNVIDGAHRFGVKKLLFLGSSCIYPKFAQQPIREDALLTGALEPTNEAYAVAKIAGLKMCQAYRSQYGFNAICAMPTNLYGPGDNFDLQTSHVLPALIRRFHEAKTLGLPSVTIWGTGAPRREFLHVDDLADACLFLMERCDASEPINVGVGSDMSILELARLVATIVGFEGEILTDPSKPDGTPRKLLDVSKLQTMGWKPSLSLEQGVRSVYAWYVDHAA